MDTDVQTLLDEISNCVQDIGKQIRSPKNDPKALDDLAKGLETIKKALEIATAIVRSRLI